MLGAVTGVLSTLPPVVPRKRGPSVVRVWQKSLGSRLRGNDEL